MVKSPVQLSLFVYLAASGCAGRFEAKEVPAGGFDAAIVLGCPNEPGGELSRCQVSRAVWAAELWRRGTVQHFITSGAAVHTPFVEAESLAAAMVALGVPAERIWLDGDALHTDENVYNGLRIAEALGFRRLAIVSNKGHAAWGCKMASDWGRACGALSVDVDVVKARSADFTPRLASVRGARVPASEWIPLDERERKRALETGRKPRPPSAVLYPYLWLAHAMGEPWVPPTPLVPPRVTWAERQAQLARR